MKALSRFVYEDREVRVVEKNGEPWFVAADVCSCLDIDTSVAVNGQLRKNRNGEIVRSGGLDEDEKDTHIVSTPGGDQELLVVSEPGLYALIFKSRVPEAKAFKRWVTHEVLPSIRKTGSYSLRPATKPATETEALLMAIQNLQQTVQILHDHGKKIQRIEDNVTTISHRVDSLDTANIEGDLQQRFERMVRRYAWAYGISYPAAWKAFDTAYNMAFRTNLTRLRTNFARKYGLKSITRPEYFVHNGTIEDAIRVADKMLASLPKRGAAHAN